MAERAGDIDDAQRRARPVGEHQRRFRRVALLDQDIVARESERVARQLHGDAIVAAEAQLRRRVELALGHVGREPDVARGQYIARNGDDGSARGDPARRRDHHGAHRLRAVPARNLQTAARGG